MNEFVSLFLIWVKAEGTYVDCVFGAVDYAVFLLLLFTVALVLVLASQQPDNRLYLYLHFMARARTTASKSKERMMKTADIFLYRRTLL